MPFRNKNPTAADGNTFGRADLDRLGLFSEVGYITTGEPYSSRKPDIRSQGKQFQTSPLKKGHDNKDAYFDKEYHRVFENEPYTDLVALRRRWRLLAKEKNITITPFKPSSVPPKPSGLGSLYGTIEQQWPLQKGEANIPVTPNNENVPKVHEKPNFYTKPPKKGTGYGFPNVTIGKQFEYMSDPYDRLHETQKKDRELHKQRQAGERTFISSSAKRDFFNPFSALIEPNHEKVLVARKKSQLPVIVPFKPSSCCGYTINKYPNYEPPVIKPGQQKGDDVQGEKKKSVSAPIFRPSGISKSYPSKSIIEANCPIAPPSWVQELYQNSKAINSGTTRSVAV